MGEFAYYAGQRIKIGTCENLTDIRAEHVPLLTGYSFSRQVLEQVRFRFPFPEEDGMVPGSLRDGTGTADLDKSLNVPGAKFEGHFDHSTIHVKTGEGGLHPKSGDRIRFSAPCPLGPDGEKVRALPEHGIHGLPAGVNVVQQRAWEGLLVLVCECPACGSRFRLPTVDDAAPVLTAIAEQAQAYADEAKRAYNLAESWDRSGTEVDHNRAEAYRCDARGAERRSSYWLTVGQRALAGYTDPPEWVVTRTGPMPPS